MVGMSTRTLEAFFASRKGECLRDGLMRCRFLRAGELLIGDCNVNQAAASVGDKDRSHFSHEFKKRFGFSPKQFARLPRAKQERLLGAHSATKI
jgi:AraC-like DNA-binding protein